LTASSGCKNRKRYQDVEEILAAGINVISTLNIQHLESINEFVEKATEVKVRETLPDRVVREAELINVDLPVDALRERPRSGLIYPPERIERALQNFFTEENPSVLRELSLHETARDLEARYTARRRADGKTAEHEQVMVAISSKPDVKRVIRRGSRVAGRKAVLCGALCPPHWGSNGRTTHYRAQRGESAITRSSSPGWELSRYQDVLSPGAMNRRRERVWEDWSHRARIRAA
jgi:K+-sensing histidine kinase KdpD